MFNKETTFVLDLNDFEIINDGLTKTASFKLPDNYSYKPGFLYVMVKAVSAGEYYGCNKNEDYFPEEELKENYRTFLTGHVFKNHENKDAANAIGHVVDSSWDDEMKCVKLLIAIDRTLAPSIARNFETGTMTDVSMGCRVNYSICSICGNKAKTRSDYCEHVRNQRGQIFDDGRMVYEINIKPKFHDISVVLNGAEKTAKVIDTILEGVTGTEKVASFEMEKVASVNPFYEMDIIDGFYDQNNMSKTANVEKKADIEKKLTDKLLSFSVNNYLDQAQRDSERNNNILRFKSENEVFLPEEQCLGIGRQLTSIAEENNFSKAKVFGMFLTMSDHAGIEFSPREIYNFYCGLKNIIPHNEKFIGKHPIDFGRKDIVKDSLRGVISSLMALPESTGEKILNSKDPVIGTRIIIKKLSSSSNPVLFPDFVAPEVQDTIAPIMGQRSMYPRFLLPRLQKISSSNEKTNETDEYFPLSYSRGEKMVKTASDLHKMYAGIIWQSYETERINNAVSDIDSIEKTAALSLLGYDDAMDKQAKLSTGTKVGLASVPITYAYSAFQRSRIRNGKNVSSANRYIAEHPDQVATGALIAGPVASKSIKKFRDQAAVKKIQGNDIYTNKKTRAENWKKYSDDVFKKNFRKGQMDRATGEYSKVNTISTKKGYRMGKKAGYSENEMDALKKSLLFEEMDREDKSQEILQKFALDASDQANYLQINDELVKIEIDKIASDKNSVFDFFANESLDRIIPVFVNKFFQ